MRIAIHILFTPKPLLGTDNNRVKIQMAAEQLDESVAICKIESVNAAIFSSISSKFENL